jgi:AcrR family transcriptional regulator
MPSERPLRADARRNYERLLVAARESVARNGVDASLDDIAKRAGVGSGTLYRHFPNRLALLEAVFKDQIQQLYERSQALIAANEAPRAALEDWLRAFLEYLTTYRGLALTLKGIMSAEEDPLAEAHAQLRQSIDTLLRNAQDAGVARPNVTGSDLLRLVSGVALALDNPPVDMGRSDRLFSIVLDGLGTTHR